MGYIKENIQIFLLIATLSMAFATAWLGWETRGLKKIDIGPNISVSDVLLETLDTDGSVTKERSWRMGEQRYPNAGTKGIAVATLAIKFINAGKVPGYIRMSNALDIGKRLNSSAVGDYGNDYHLVPANSETGWLYPFDIWKAPREIPMTGDQYLSIPYNFEIYDSNLSSPKKIDISVRCLFPIQTTLQGVNYVNLICYPIVPEPIFKKSLKDFWIISGILIIAAFIGYYWRCRDNKKLQQT